MNKILTSRPSDMDHEAYRTERTVQKKQIKNYLRHGRLVWRGNKTFVGSTKTLKPI